MSDEKQEPLTAEEIYNNRITEEDTTDGYLYKPNFELTIKDEFIEGCKEFSYP